MKKLEEIILFEDRLYTDEHIWAKQYGDILFLGISDFAQDQLGEIAYVELPELNKSFQAKEAFGTVESLKSVNSLFMPVNGSIIEINTSLEDSPTLLNANCYENWIVKVKAQTENSEVTLMNSQDYRAFLEK